MRTHEGNRPEVNHQIYSDDDTMRKFARLTNIYEALYEIRVEAVLANTNFGKLHWLILGLASDYFDVV